MKWCHFFITKNKHYKGNLLFVFFLFLSCASFAQLSQDTRANLPTVEEYQKKTKYQTVLNLGNKTSVKGLLYKVTDKEIILIPNDERVKDYSYFIMLVKKKQIPVSIPIIKRMGTRKRGKLGKNILIGTGVGLALGLLVISSGDGESLVTGSAITIPVLTGSLLGLLIGISSKSHNLNNKAELEKLKSMGIMF